MVQNSCKTITSTGGKCTNPRTFTFNGTVSRIPSSRLLLTDRLLQVPSSEDIDLAIEILERVQKPALEVVETLLKHTSKWDNSARNDFCRYLHAIRCAWVGLSTIIKLPPVQSPNPLLESYELPEMVLSHLDVNCGFALSNPEDPRYQKVLGLRERYGQVVLRAASLLRQNAGGEDHIDALITVTRAVDTYLIGYCASRGQFEDVQKSYRNNRE